MAAFDTTGAVAWARFEVGVEKKCSLFHEATEMGFRILDNYRKPLSFSDVHPASVTVRNLGVEVDTVTSVVDTLTAKFTKSKVGDVEGDVVGGIRRKILRDVSGIFPAGTLTAVIGGSGSGKVRLHPRTLCLANLISYFACRSYRRPSLTFFPIACGDRTSLSPEAYVTTNPPTFSQSPAPMSPKPTS